MSTVTSADRPDRRASGGSASVWSFSRTGTRIEKALLGSDAGLYGAAYLPFQREAAYRVPTTS